MTRTPESPLLDTTTLTDRWERGRETRRTAPRRELGRWDPGIDRPDPVATVRAQDTIRLPELAPLRAGRMAASAWNFYRGAAAVMAADLARGPRSGLEVQLCGDAHILNFGLWATPERNLAFDLRDFDETLPGPFEWDVKRLAASIVVVARHNGLADRTAADAVDAAMRAYRNRMAHYAEAGQLEIWYDAVYVEQLLGYFAGKRRRNVSSIIEEGGHRTSRGAYGKLTEIHGGRRRIVEKPPKLTHYDDPDRMAMVDEVFRRYAESLQEDRRHCLEQFTFVDKARQVVGVGSVGMRVFLVLLSGPAGDDPLFLQIKQAGPSVYEPFLGPSRYDNHGERVVHGKRLVQSATDIFVGWTRYQGVDFYVRQFRDMKIIPESNRIAPGLTEFATACGEVMAKAHARSGDPVAIAAYLGGGRAFREAMTGFAVAYADQNDADHRRWCEAIASGEIDARSE